MTPLFHDELCALSFAIAMEQARLSPAAQLVKAILPDYSGEIPDFETLRKTSDASVVLPGGVKTGTVKEEVEEVQETLVVDTLAESQPVKAPLPDQHEAKESGKPEAQPEGKSEETTEELGEHGERVAPLQAPADPPEVEMAPVSGGKEVTPVSQQPSLAGAEVEPTQKEGEAPLPNEVPVEQKLDGEKAEATAESSDLPQAPPAADGTAMDVTNDKVDPENTTLEKEVVADILASPAPKAPPSVPDPTTSEASVPPLFRKRKDPEGKEKKEKIEKEKTNKAVKKEKKQKKEKDEGSSAKQRKLTDVV